MRFLYPYCVVVLILSTTQLLQAAEMLYPLSVAATDKGPLYVADRKLECRAGESRQLFHGIKSVPHPVECRALCDN